MRAVLAVVALLGGAAVLAGCPAQAVVPHDAAPEADVQADAAPDAGVDLDAADAAPADLGQADACAAEAVEVACDDGCDNDGDGFVDEDDPDCTPTFLVTREPPDDGVLRWRVGADVAVLHARPLDDGGVPVVAYRPTADTAQVADRGFAVKRGFGASLCQFSPQPDPAPGPQAVGVPLGYQPADVCLVQDRVVVVESYSSSRPPAVHAYAAGDPATEVASLALADAVSLRACATDGEQVFVVVAQSLPPDVVTPDVIARLTVDLEEQPPRLPLPTGLAAGTTRLIDLAYERRSGRFYGLFTAGELNTAEVVPFVMGGAAETAVTAPFALNNLGTFAP